MDELVGVPQESPDPDAVPDAVLDPPLDLGPGLEPISTTAALADQVGLTVTEFVEVFGAGWQLLPHHADGQDDAPADDPADAPDVERWHVAGEPYQLALRPQDGGVELGLPTGNWVGAGELDWQVGDRQHVPGGPDREEAAGAAIAELLRRRRRTFRFCRYCRTHTAPEQLLNPDTCYACGTQWLGLAY